MANQPLKPFVIAMTFGNQPHQQTVVDAVMAPNDVSAVAMAVSKAHTTRAIGDMLDGMCVAELTDDFITAAHRGTAEPAPVLSIVPQTLADMPKFCNICYSNQHNAEEHPQVALSNSDVTPPDGAA